MHERSGDSLHIEINISKCPPLSINVDLDYRTACDIILFGKNGQTKYRPGTPVDLKHGQKCENYR